MFQRFLHDFKKYFRYSIVSAKAQLKAEVADSYLNWVWWILEPFCFMLVYAFIFGYVFNSREQYFPIYIFIGLSMWNFFNKTAQSSVKMIKANKNIISKVYFPKHVLLITRIWRNGFKMMVSFGIVVVMLLVYRVPLSWNVLFVVPVLLVFVLFTFALSCFMMHYGVYINDLSNVTAILFRMLFYLTGIMFNLEKRVPEYGAALNRYNPVAFLITSMRQCLLYSQRPALRQLAVWFLVSALLAMLGIRKIYKEENSYVKAI